MSFCVEISVCDTGLGISTSCFIISHSYTIFRHIFLSLLNCRMLTGKTEIRLYLTGLYYHKTLHTGRMTAEIFCLFCFSLLSKWFGSWEKLSELHCQMNCVVIHLIVSYVFCVVLFPVAIIDSMFDGSTLFSYISSERTSLQDVLIKPRRHMILLISDPSPSINAVFFNEISFMIAEHKYLENIWNIRIFIEVTLMSILISKIIGCRKEQLELLHSKTMQYEYDYDYCVLITFYYLWFHIN